MDIVQTFLDMALLGSAWVLWLLLVLSIVSVAIIIERIMFFNKMKLNYGEFRGQLSSYLVEGKLDQAEEYCRHNTTIESQVALRGFEQRDRGSTAMDETMTSYLLGERQHLDRGLVVLGTLGNNAPFIGLFGTVIGIIEAFNSLAQNAGGGPSVVMAGISEALVATAVGLLVAIPAVIAFNAFNRVIRRRMANAESIKGMLLAQLGK